MKKRVNRRNWELAFLFMYPAKRILEDRREIVPFQDCAEKMQSFRAAISGGIRRDHEEASQRTKRGVGIIIHVSRERILEERMEKLPFQDSSTLDR